MSYTLIAKIFGFAMSKAASEYCSTLCDICTLQVLQIFKFTWKLTMKYIKICIRTKGYYFEHLCH